MPLEKSITDNSGVTSTYWVISHIQADMQAETASASLAGYLSVDTYKAGNKPSARRQFFFTIPFATIPSATSGSLSVEEVYTAIMAQIADPKRAAPSPLAGATLVA